MARRIRYVSVWSDRWITSHAKTLKDMVDGVKDAAKALREMVETGKIEAEGHPGERHLPLVTYDAKIAKQFGFRKDDEQ